METLGERLRQDARANDHIAGACATLHDEQARTVVPGICGSVIETLSHPVSAEHNDLGVIEGVAFRTLFP